MTRIPISASSTDAIGLAEHLRILSRPDWVAPVARFLRDQAARSGLCDSAQAERLVICLTEAITNAIVHGNYELDSSLKGQGDAFARALAQRQDDPAYNSRVVDIRVERSAEKAVWTIADQGRGFDVQALLARLDSPDPTELLASGRGVAIMRAFVDDVDWADHGRRIRLTICADRGAEQRRAARRSYTEAVEVRLPAGGVVHAIGRDLSAGGVAFVAGTELAPGSRAAIALAGQAGCVEAEIVRCNPIAPPYFDVAAAFNEPVDAEAILAGGP